MSKIKYSSIPQILKDKKAWCVWRYENRLSKKTGKIEPTKVPRHPITLFGAKSNKSYTWASYDTAVTVFERRKNLAGLGYFLNDDHVGIDLDKCRDPATGTISEEAMAIIRNIDSYTEVSPSGKGIRIFAHGRLPGQDYKNGHYEMYDKDSPRFMTVTGNHLAGTPSSLQERQEAIDAFHKQHIARPERPKVERPTTHTSEARPPAPTGQGRPLRQAFELCGSDPNDGETFKALWRGEWPGKFPSQSEADAWLVSHLANYLGPRPDLVDALFRRSGLMRPKWDEYHGHLTIGQRTLKFCDRDHYYDWACEVEEIVRPFEDGAGQDDLTGTYDGIEMLRRSKESKTAYIFDGLLETGVISLFTGLPYSGKSLAILQLVKAMAKGEAFYGRTCHIPRVPVLYINADRLRDRQIHRRLATICGDDAELLTVLPYLQFTETSDLPATVTGDYVRRLIRGMKVKHGSDVVLVVIDTLRPAFLMEQGPGAENDPGTMTQLLGPVRQLAGETNCPILLLHHNNRSRNDYAGSAAIAGNTEAVWTITKNGHLADMTIENRDGGLVTLTVTLGPKPLDLEPEADPLLEFINQFPTQAGEALTRKQAADLFPDVSDGTLRNRLADAQRPGVEPRLEQVGTGTKEDPYRYFRV